MLLLKYTHSANISSTKISDDQNIVICNLLTLTAWKTSLNKQQ